MSLLWEEGGAEVPMAGREVASPVSLGGVWEGLGVMEPSKPYKVLQYTWLDMGDPHWKAWRIGKLLTGITQEYGLIPHVDPLHGPLHGVPWFSESLHAEVRKKSFKTKMAEGWHFDGDTTPGAKPDCAIVVWASMMPTEILWEGGIYQPEAWELSIFRNLSVKHRRPEGVPKKRWVFRQRVSVPKHFDLP